MTRAALIGFGLASAATAHGGDLLVSPLGPAMRGEVLELELSLPVSQAGGIRVIMMAGGLGSGACPSSFQGACLDIYGQLQHLEGVTTNASGSAMVAYEIPVDYPTQTLAIQAISRSPSGTVYLSDPVVLDVVGVDLDGDGIWAANDCDDTNPDAWILEGPAVPQVNDTNIDDFCTGYCTRTVIGNVVDWSRTDLDALRCLTSVGGDLYIKNQATLEDIDGLANLTSIGGNLWLWNNDILTHVDGLANLTSVGGDLWLWKNEELTNVDGLANLTSIGGFLEVFINDSLIDLDGLSSLTSIGGFLEIWDNDALTDLDGLANITSLNAELKIYSNDALTNIDGLANVTSVGGFLDIYGNNSLLNLDGLANVTFAGSEVRIYENSRITHLDGLGSLAYVGGYLYLYGNNVLNNIDGLKSLATIYGHLEITDNPMLCQSAVDVFAAGVSVGGTVTTHSNDDGC